MKKILLVILSLFLWSAANVVAQVRIGGTGDPQGAAVLDLNADNNATPTGNKGALALPRVNLTSATLQLNSTTPLNGMMVYHTGTALDGAGVYVWSGGKWIKVSYGLAPVITTQPAKFSFKRLLDPAGDPKGPAVAGTAISVTATNATKYQWYKKAINENAPDTLINGATSAAYTFTPKGTGKVNWGLTKFYCVVSNDYDSIKSNIAEVAYGCGAKTNDNRWLRFMCHNLGAAEAGTSEALDAVTVAYGTTAADTTTKDAKGFWFQWGRQADGHQWRSSTAIAGPDTIPTINDGSTSAKRKGFFITNGDMYTALDWRYPQHDQLWRNWSDDNRFPCPSGWRVPSSSEWGTIYRRGGHYGTPDEAVSNYWVWSNSPRGYKIQPDGATTTLFLPAAGARNHYGTGHAVGSTGIYWSSTSASGGVRFLEFHAAKVSPECSFHRAYGVSVRCLAE